MNVPNILLAGVVGSTAYGLAGPDSDVDRLGVFAAPTVAFHGLHAPKDSYVTSKPDATYHEAAKACRLILGGNPTAAEILWLPDDLYEARTHLGNDLIAIRSAFLCAPRVRDAYLGYATQQFRKLETRGDGSFSADTRKRTAKHARHLLRLCHQGLHLYQTGRLVIRLDEPDRFRRFGERVAAGDIDHARQAMADYERAFTNTPSALPDRPDEAVVERWLLRVRAAHLDPATRPASGFAAASTGTLRQIQANLHRGLDVVAGHLEAGTFHTTTGDGKAPPSESGQVTLALLDGVNAELATRTQEDR